MGWGGGAGPRLLARGSGRRIGVAGVLFTVAAGLASAQGVGNANGPMSSNRAAVAAPAASAPAGAGEFDVGALFATTCGWCHSSGGRVAGKGPQLMGTALTDGEILYRIKTGKVGAMPAFKGSFSDAQLVAIVKYIRELKADGTTPP